MTARRILKGFGLFCIAAPVICSAQAPDVARRCAEIEDSAERLTCYDRVFRETASGEVSPEAAAPIVESSPNQAAPASTAGVRSPNPSRDVHASSAVATNGKEQAQDNPSGKAVDRNSESGRAAGSQRAESARAPAVDTPQDHRDEALKVSELTAVVARVTKRARGQHVVVLENGQIWQENFASSYFPVDPGDRIVIKKRRFGGYRLVTTSGKGFRVARVQ